MSSFLNKSNESKTSSGLPISPSTFSYIVFTNDSLSIDP